MLLAVNVALISHFNWIAEFRMPPTADHGFHLAESAAFSALVSAPLPLGEKLLTLWTWPGPYPSAVYFVTWLWERMAGNGSHAALASFTPFIMLLAIGAYLLGHAVAGRPTAVAAMVLVLLDPTLLHTQRHYWLDMPLAAVVVFSLAALQRCNVFSDRPWSLTLGACLGVGLLTKATYVWFMALPLAWTILLAMRDALRPQALRTVGGIAAALVLFSALCRLSLSQMLYMQRLDTLAPAFSWFLVAASSALWLAGWIAARRLTAIPRNLCQSFAIAAFIAGPWVVVNQHMIKERWRPVVEAIGYNLQHLPESIHEGIDAIPWPVLGMAVLGLLTTLLWKERRRLLLPLVMAWAAGAPATVILLPDAARYRVVLTVLIAILAVAWVPRRRWIAMPVAGLSVAMAVINLFGVALWFKYPKYDDALGLMSEITRRKYADADSSDRDFEWDAVEALRHVPPQARSVYILSSDNLERVWQVDLYFMLAAQCDWQHRVLDVRTAQIRGSALEFQEMNPIAADRQRVLARAEGLPTAAFPSRSEPQNITPDYVIATVDAERTLAVARRFFHGVSWRTAYSTPYMTLVERY